MLKLVPDLKFWESIKTEPVFSLTYFLTKENKARFLHEYERFKAMANFDLDKMKEMTWGVYDPRVIIRTSIGAKEPLNGGVQHT